MTTKKLTQKQIARDISLQRLNYIFNFALGAVAVLLAFTLYKILTS